MGGLIPFAGAFAPTAGAIAVSIVSFTLVGLFATGLISARTSGAAVMKPTVRVMIGGCLGMAITASIGHFAHLSGI
jgi:VIT1/CCC1 family predicted Fe2+/Mn2+ transporter